MGTISVLVVTRHRERSLARALKSLQRQTWTDWEAVIVDNGASPTTAQVVADCRDRRLSYVAAGENLGECGGRNHALRRSSGPFVCYLDDDDLLPRHSLRDRMAFLDAHPECGMVYGEYLRLQCTAGTWRRARETQAAAPYFRKRYYDAVLRRVDYDREWTHYVLKHFNFIRGGTPLIRRDALEAVGMFDDQLDLFGDYDLWLRLAACYPIRFFEKVVYIYRVHAGSTSLLLHGTEAAGRSVQRICRKHGIRDNVHFDSYGMFGTAASGEARGHA